MIISSGIRLVPLAAVASLAVALAPAVAQASAAPAAGSWAVQAVPVPQSKISLFNSVSCAMPGNCAAVGILRRKHENARVLIETSKNGHWSISPAPQPGNGGNSLLLSVSCPVTNFCMTVGRTSGTGGGVSPVSEVWDGKTWRMGGAGGGNAVLNSVSCRSAKFCMAVGETVEPAMVQGVRVNITHPLAERWNGSGWSVLPAAPIAKVGELHAVSCSSDAFCMAIGTAHLNGSNTFPVAEHWNGDKFSLITALGLAHDLNSVACATPAWCVTTGATSTRAHRALAQRWNGTTWKSFPVGPAGSTLHGVDCTSNSACTAIGNAGRGSFAASWNGGSWGVAALPSGRHWSKSVLSSVDCTPAGHCTAAGWAMTPAGQVPAVLAS